MALHTFGIRRYDFNLQALNSLQWKLKLRPNFSAYMNIHSSVVVGAPPSLRRLYKCVFLLRPGRDSATRSQILIWNSTLGTQA